MAVTESAGADRARGLLNGIPDRFNDFCHMDQITFVQLADWMVANVDSQISEPCISIEESLFVFLDIVAQGNSFRNTAYGWNHDIKLTHGIFLNVMNALHVLREKEQFSPSCPKFNANKSRWRITRGLRPGKSRMDGKVKIGEENGDGLEISKEDLIQALTTLNNFIHDYKEF